MKQNKNRKRNKEINRTNVSGQTWSDKIGFVSSDMSLSASVKLPKWPLSINLVNITFTRFSSFSLAKKLAINSYPIRVGLKHKIKSIPEYSGKNSFKNHWRHQVFHRKYHYLHSRIQIKCIFSSVKVRWWFCLKIKWTGIFIGLSISLKSLHKQSIFIWLRATLFLLVALTYKHVLIAFFLWFPCFSSVRRYDNMRFQFEIERKYYGRRKREIVVPQFQIIRFYCTCFF